MSPPKKIRDDYLQLKHSLEDPNTDNKTLVNDDKYIIALSDHRFSKSIYFENILLLLLQNGLDVNAKNWPWLERGRGRKSFLGYCLCSIKHSCILFIVASVIEIGKADVRVGEDEVSYPYMVARRDSNNKEVCKSNEIPTLNLFFIFLFCYRYSNIF